MAGVGSKTTQRGREAASAINSLDRNVFPWSVVCGAWSVVCGLFSKNVITGWHTASEGATLSCSPDGVFLFKFSCIYADEYDVFRIIVLCF